MVQINFARKEVNCKIVFYGPGMSGKTTNLEKIFENAPDGHKGDLTSIATEGDRTLFFDFLPLDLGTVAGMNTKFQLYTVPGQVYYNSTRKLVLQGADGVIFVADSQRKKMEENMESLENLEDNLKEYNLKIDEIPLVLQWNKRDMPDALPVEELEAKLNRWGAPTFPAVAITGEGVFPTLKALSSMVLENLNKEYGVSSSAAESPAKPKPEPKPPVQKPAQPSSQPQQAVKQQTTPERPAPPQPQPQKSPTVAQPQPQKAPVTTPAKPQPAIKPQPERAPLKTPQTPARPKSPIRTPIQPPTKGSKAAAGPATKTNPLIYVIILVLALVIGAVILVVLNPGGSQ